MVAWDVANTKTDNIFYLNFVREILEKVILGSKRDFPEVGSLWTLIGDIRVSFLTLFFLNYNCSHVQL